MDSAETSSEKRIGSPPGMVHTIQLKAGRGRCYIQTIWEIWSEVVLFDPNSPRNKLMV